MEPGDTGAAVDTDGVCRLTGLLRILEVVDEEAAAGRPLPLELLMKDMGELGISEAVHGLLVDDDDTYEEAMAWSSSLAYPSVDAEPCFKSL